jgi:SAM-dependent methyltransferase
MNDLRSLRDGWDHAARTNAMVNICTSQAEWKAEDFFAHGRAEVDRVIENLRDILPEREHALDFGCGVGRLSQALARHFYRVTGVDISGEMVDQARKLLPEGERVKYAAIPSDNPILPIRMGTFDLVYTTIVLQHMPHDLQRAYLREFLRVLKPEGIASFQLPHGPTVPHGAHYLSMWGADPLTVGEWVEEDGGVVLGDDVEGQDGGWESHRYTVGKA